MRVEIRKQKTEGGTFFLPAFSSGSSRALCFCAESQGVLHGFIGVKNPLRDAAQPTELVRFGVYEADLRSGELRKNGLKLKLSGQPFQVLALLLERPGDLVLPFVNTVTYY